MRSALSLLSISSLLVASAAFAETPATASVYCPKLSVVMERGARGSEVMEFQKFIAAYYKVETNEIVTGYFGPITHGYAVRFQKEVGLPSFGYVGGLTRAAIAKVCGGASMGVTPSVTVTGQGTSTPAIPVVAKQSSTIGIGGVFGTNVVVSYHNMPAANVRVVNKATGATVLSQQLTNFSADSGARGAGSIVLALPATTPSGSYYLQAVSPSGAVIASSALFSLGGTSTIEWASVEQGTAATSSAIVMGSAGGMTHVTLRLASSTAVVYEAQISVTDGKWSHTIPTTIGAGLYTLSLYSPTNKLLLSGGIEIKAAQ